MAELFLEAFEPLRRGLIGNQFCFAVREGRCKTPETIVAWVKADAIKRGGYEKTAQQQDLLLDVIDMPEALRFAQYVLDRENLPPSLKAKIHEQNTARFRARWMEKQPPTRKQLSYLEGLGCHVIPANKHEASQLIEKYKSGNV